MVLVTGESGTGKQAIARMLHDGSARARRARSSSSTARRSPRRWSRASCSVTSAAPSPTRASASWAWSRSPTAARCSSTRSATSAPAAQAKLLTFLEQRTFRRVGATSVRRVDARVVAATNRDLREHGRGAHAPRGSVLSAERHHRSPAAAARAAARTSRRWRRTSWRSSAREFGRRFAAIAPETTGVLAAYRWPGNVRELRAVISRAVLMHDDEQLRVDHLPPELVAAALSAPPAPSAARGGSRRRPARSRRSRRSSSRTSGACSRFATATARSPPSTSASPVRHWRNDSNQP